MDLSQYYDNTDFAEEEKPKKETKKPEFVDRIENPDKYPYISNEDGSISTHRMAAEVDEKGQWLVFPTIVQKDDGSLHEFEDNMEAMKYNKQAGNYLAMGSKEEAIAYAEGGYKKGKAIETFNPLEQDRTKAK
tara:strand:- start:2719 stop:3117 length:399 start_codon:yes stop_codon:yes gene_type:complete